MKYTLHVILCSLLISIQVQPMLARSSQLQKALSALTLPIVGRAIASIMNEDNLDYRGQVSKFHVDAITNSRKKCAELLQNQSNEKQRLLDEQKKEEERKKRDSVSNDSTDICLLQSLLLDDKKDEKSNNVSSLQRLAQEDLSDLSKKIFEVASSAVTVDDIISLIEDSDND